MKQSNEAIRHSRVTNQKNDEPNFRKKLTNIYIGKCRRYSVFCRSHSVFAPILATVNFFTNGPSCIADSHSELPTSIEKIKPKPAQVVSKHDYEYFY